MTFWLLTLQALGQPEDWDNYVMAVNGKPVSVVVNLALKDQAPAKSRPYGIILRLSYPEMDDKGFPALELADELNRLESELEARLRQKNGAWYAGRFTQRGIREFYFYTLDTMDYLGTCAAILRQHPRFPFLVKAVNDRNWTNYFEVLYPRDEEKEKMENRRTVEELEKKGDELTTPRAIDHTFYFRSDWHRRAFLIALDLPGFQVTEIPVEKASDREGPAFRLVLRRTDKPVLSPMNELTIRLSRAARKHEGVYEGWSTYVVTK